MARKAHLVIDQASAFSTTIYLKDDNGDVLSLSGYTANAAMKKWYTSSNAIQFVATTNTDLGSITLEMTANTTANIVAGRYVYDIHLIHSVSGTPSRVVEGYVTVTPAVTGMTVPPANTNYFPNSSPIT